MIDEHDPILLASVKKHEGWRPYAYRDSLGYLTIGYGRLIDQQKGGGITEQEGEMLLSNDLAGSVNSAPLFVKNYHELSENRQRVVIEMIFNLGSGGFAKFKNTIAAIERGDYEAAAKGMLSSLWAKQVKGRAKTLAEMMKQG